MAKKHKVLSKKEVQYHEISNDISDDSSKEPTQDINIASIFKKVKIQYIILLALLLFGFYLRFYHVQYPVIGYHNWKVAHYISEARNFAREGFFKYGFFVPMRDTTENIAEPPDGEHNDTFPAISIVVGFLFKIFGESLVVARLTNIFFSLGSVIVFYLLIKALFAREDFALLCAFLAAVNPMYVFFSHNVDVINPGLFFMLIGAYYYIRWLKEHAQKFKFSYLYLAAFFVMLGAITKYTFIVIAIPMALTFPFKLFFKNTKKFIIPLVIAVIISAAFPGWFYYSEVYIKNNVFGKEISKTILDSYEITKLIDFSIIWSNDFWQTMKAYVADNFSIIGIWFAFFGLILFLMLYFTKNKDNLGYRFMMSYFLGTLAFVFVMGFKLSGHSYHQFPIAPFIIYLIAYFMDVISANIVSFVKNKESRIFFKIAIIALIIFALPFPASSLYSKSIEAKDRMFDTQYPGLDIAGEYIHAHAGPNDRLMHSSGQSFGVVWHAETKGYKMSLDLNYTKKAEDIYNVSWIFIYQWAIPGFMSNPEYMAHLSKNYKLVEIAFVPISDQQVQPLYFLFQKGGTFNESQLNSELQKAAQEGKILTRTYYRAKSTYEVKYIDLE